MVDEAPKLLKGVREWLWLFSLSKLLFVSGLWYQRRCRTEISVW